MPLCQNIIRLLGCHSQTRRLRVSHQRLRLYLSTWTHIEAKSIDNYRCTNVLVIIFFQAPRSGTAFKSKMTNFASYTPSVCAIS